MLLLDSQPGISRISSFPSPDIMGVEWMRSLMIEDIILLPYTNAPEPREMELPCHVALGKLSRDAVHRLVGRENC